MAEEKKEAVEEVEEIVDEQLQEVNGGTFDPNMYSEEVYNKHGIKTDYHFFEKDEFWVWCNATNSWKPISYEQANEIIQLEGAYMYCGYGKMSWETYQWLKSEYDNYPEKFYHRI